MSFFLFREAQVKLSFESRTLAIINRRKLDVFVYRLFQLLIFYYCRDYFFIVPLLSLLIPGIQSQCIRDQSIRNFIATKQITVQYLLVVEGFSILFFARMYYRSFCAIEAHPTSSTKILPVATTVRVYSLTSIPWQSR